MGPTTVRLCWLLLLLFAFGLRSPVLLAPLEHLVTVLPDDAFYYFETARNIASGLGSTFDGQDLADGYQPLWMALLLPLALLPKMVFLKAALLLGIVLHLSALIALGRSVFLITRHHAAALLAALIYTCNRWAILQSVNGLETALTSALFCVCLWLLVQFQITDPDSRNSWRWAGTIGVATALLFLARTDQIFYCGAFLVASLVLAKRRWIWVMRVAVAGLLIALPWVLGHWLWAGSLLPSSGGAQPLIMRTLADIKGVTVDRGWVSFRGFFTGGVFGFTGHDRRLVVPLLGLAGFATLLRYRNWTQLQRTALGLLALLAAAGFLLGSVHTYIRWYPRTWYFDQYIILVATFLAIGAGSVLDLKAQILSSRPGLRRTALASLGIAALLCTLPLWLAASSGWRSVTEGNYPIQKRNYLAARWIDSFTASEAVIGGWNTGILAFTLEQPVVGLDGAISATALPYLRQRDLTRLLCERGVNYLADHSGEFERYRPFLPGYERYAADPFELLAAEPAESFWVQRVGRHAFDANCEVTVRGNEAP